MVQRRLRRRPRLCALGPVCFNPSVAGDYAGFLDDDVNADPENPYADMGDLAFAAGFDVGCVEVVIADADATGADFQLNINVPF